MSRWYRWLLRRWALWSLLLLLIAGMFVLLIWLTSRYEVTQKQAQLQRETQAAVNDLHAALMQQAEPLQSLQFQLHDLKSWHTQAAQVLKSQRALLGVQWRDRQLKVLANVDSPYQDPLPLHWQTTDALAEIQHACALSSRLNTPAYGGSLFVQISAEWGQEVLPLCLPVRHEGRLAGYLVAAYSLQDMLANMVNPIYTREAQLTLMEVDGSRLASFGRHRQGDQLYSARQILELPGNSLVLQMQIWHDAPEIFPNALSALIVSMAVALVVVLFMLAHDTRRRMRVEHDLAEALAFRKAMEDSLVTGLRARDNQGRITYVNPAFCEMVGFGLNELLGTDIPAPYWPPEHIEEYQKRQEQRLTGQASAREGAESVFIRKNGERFPVLIFEAPLINAAGLQTGWMSAVLDISEQRRVEEISRASHERLQATARLAMVGEMASLLSHELNQPLAAISSYATGSLNWLNDAQDSPATLHEHLREAMARIANQAERAGKVIKSVHDFVRRRDQAHETLSPSQLLENVLPLVNLQARKLRVRVQVHCPVDLPAVVCDRTMVEQVLLNLARNGMQAMEGVTHTRVLSLSVREASGVPRRMEFDVADVGCGISEVIEAQLFTPFFTTKQEGMGLGLSFCRTVVEQHGGSLTHRSHAPSGTIFTFTLPQA